MRYSLVFLFLLNVSLWGANPEEKGPATLNEVFYASCGYKELPGGVGLARVQALWCFFGDLAIVDLQGSSPTVAEGFSPIQISFYELVRNVRNSTEGKEKYMGRKDPVSQKTPRQLITDFFLRCVLELQQKQVIGEDVEAEKKAGKTITFPVLHLTDGAPSDEDSDWGVVVALNRAVETVALQPRSKFLQVLHRCLKSILE